MTGATERWLAPVDRRLLERLESEPNLVRAARATGIGRDRAVYRLRRLARLFGGPIAEGRRGGRSPGGTHLTPLGRRLLRSAEGRSAGGNRWTGTFRATPAPHVVLDGGGELEVAFRAREAARVAVEVAPEAFVVGRSRVALSARNVLAGEIETVRRRADGTARLTMRWGGVRVRVALTSGSVGRLGLRPGRRAYLYVKAVAVRRGASPGSPRP